MNFWTHFAAKYHNFSTEQIAHMKVRRFTATALIALLVTLPILATAAPDDPLVKAGVIQLQKCLNKKGFDAGVADGVAGKRTINAYKALQKSINVEPTGEMKVQAIFDCSSVKVEKKNKNIKGTLPVTSSIDSKTYQLVWDAKEQPYFGFRVSYYFDAAAEKTSRFRFQSSTIRYQCENGVEEKKTPNGAFRKGKHAPAHKDVCGGKDGALVSVGYAQ